MHSVILTWIPPTSGGTVVSYDVKRAPVVAGVTGTYASIASPEPTAATYTDIGPFVEGNQYSYDVSSVNSAGESAPCTAVTVTIPFSLPQPPTGLSAVAS